MIKYETYLCETDFLSRNLRKRVKKKVQLFFLAFSFICSFSAVDLDSISGWHRHRLTDPGPLSSRSNAGRTGRAKRRGRGAFPRSLRRAHEGAARLSAGKWKSIVFFRRPMHLFPRKVQARTDTRTRTCSDTHTNAGGRRPSFTLFRRGCRACPRNVLNLESICQRYLFADCEKERKR